MVEKKVSRMAAQEFVARRWTLGSDSTASATTASTTVGSSYSLYRSDIKKTKEELEGGREDTTTKKRESEIRGLHGQRWASWSSSAVGATAAGRSGGCGCGSPLPVPTHPSI